MNCRACEAPQLLPVLSLGDLPRANGYLTEAQLSTPETHFPLELVYCPNCTLVQITYTLPPETLFSEYPYFTSISDAYVEHARSLVERLALRKPRHVLEIASNDGYLLQHYQARDISILGVEPARNVARVAIARGIPTLNEFFGRDLARGLEPADIIHANNVLAHVADLNGFIAGLKMVLSPEGLLVIEVPYIQDLIEQVAFDTIYHEHLCYFSLTALDRLMRSHELQIASVERLTVHGGSLRCFISHSARADASVVHLLEHELKTGIASHAYYADFGPRVERLREELRSSLSKLKGQGQRLAAYGASAKGTTLLNYTQIGAEILAYVVDRSPAKQGLFTPGTHLPIYSPERLNSDPVDYLLLLTWNFADEILAQQAAFRARGGQFIIPVPSPRIVS